MNRWLILLPLLACACGVMSLPAKSDVLPNPQPPLESPETAQEAPGTKFDGILTHSTPETVYCVTAAETLNLRLAPSTMAEGLGVLYHGVRVSVLGTGAGWLKVETEDGRSGWVKSEYIGGCK